MPAAAMPPLARALEEGWFDGPVARLLARAWGGVAARAVARPLACPAHVRVVAVGGATLGGSGKTPLAVACARALAAQGERVALVGHAYRARPGRARVVSPDAPDDVVAEVGDEALVSARALAAAGVPVVVAPTRADAVALASRTARVLVLDGVLQTSPLRAALALLAVDADEPWGRVGDLPPRGDLRAPRRALLAAADAVVAVGDDADVSVRLAAGKESPSGHGHAAVLHARLRSRGATLAHDGGALVPWDELSRLRVGLACALARPARLLRFLRRRGVVPVALAAAGDHAAIPARAFGAQVDVWLATPKCALHLPPGPGGRGMRLAQVLRVGGAPVATIDHDVVLSPALSARLPAGSAAP